ncbi:hypothetical protein RVR_8287 [Actinacidiphila reveromycinica]|uniref:Uncharacterized protein n=1 Tax=Actinacidiphila reveromycinica TaxID=659352 RepID=A0A7U3UYC7_9ACTN|nr:hypothetical protein [Streptomyces sp. SN-593]BBB01051.1 hypothetical protein RVR_8287 [Streptomyces sp. SN-593]
MIRAHACYSAVCDACGEPLRDPDSEAEVHFATEDEARRVARSYRWPVTSGALICPETDPEHQAALDRLMPAEPMPLNQPTLDGETA